MTTNGSPARRSRWDIIADILRLGQASKTGIMYGGNLSYSLANGYLDLLLRCKCLEERYEKGRSVFHTTTIGLSVIRGIDQLSEILGEIPGEEGVSRREVGDGS